jgi:alcohol dehydrogenase
VFRLKLVFDGSKLVLQEGSSGEYKVKACGICGTDIAILKGSYKPRKTPIVLGHEFCVEKDGKLFVSEINLVDWSCENCKKGEYTHCENRKAIGIDVDGALQDRIDLPSYLLHEVPDGLSAAEAALAEPVASVLRMLQLLDPKPYESALILGDGALGLISCALLKRFGLDVSVKGKHEQRLKRARLFGARVESENRKYDIVVEATGKGTLDEALSHTKARGRIAIKSTHGSSVCFDYTKAVVNEVQIVPSRCAPFYLWDKALKLVKELRLGELVTVYPFRNYEEAISNTLERKIVKPVLVF